MTKEEAINDLKDFIDTYLTVHGEEDTIAVSLDNVDVEAFHMAIKALEPKPMEKFKGVKDHIFKLASDYKCWDNRLTDDEALELCHILEQEPKTGHWIFAEGIKGKDNVEKCSCCGSHWKEAIIYRMDTQEYLRTRLLYCPNCGSRNGVKE